MIISSGTYGVYCECCECMRTRFEVLPIFLFFYFLSPVDRIAFCRDIFNKFSLNHIIYYDLDLFKKRTYDMITKGYKSMYYSISQDE